MSIRRTSSWVLPSTYRMKPGCLGLLMASAPNLPRDQLSRGHGNEPRTRWGHRTRQQLVDEAEAVRHQRAQLGLLRRSANLVVEHQRLREVLPRRIAAVAGGH